MSFFERITAHDPKKIALHDGKQGVRYGDLLSEIQGRADKLAGVVGVLGLSLDNGIEWVLWDLAARKAGIPCVPLPPFFSGEQLSHAHQSAGVSHILSSHGMRSTGVSLGALPQGTAKVTFTSGTTGRPKGVCLPQSAMDSVAASIVDVLGNEFAGHHLCVLPLAVLLENVAGVYAGLLAGCTIHLRGLQDFGEHYANLHTVMKETRAGTAILVPEILKILMGQVAEHGGLPDLKFVAIGGSKVDAELMRTARHLGLPVYEGYGLSECASVVSLNTPDHDCPGTVGKVLPHVRARIVDGEIQINDPGFLGYVGEKKPDVLHTGDLGQMDEQGYLSVTGRKKNVLITSYGRNISPEWVEAVLLGQPDIAQAIVYGDAQPSLSALIVPSSKQANIQRALAQANEALPDYARIIDIKIIPPFTIADGTLTGTGRPRREKILALYNKENSHELLQSAS